VIPLAIVAGYVAGFLIAVATVAAETSRIAFGNYALYGSGAIIVPAILAPFALYPGWIGLIMRGGDCRLEAALYTLGLHLGVGMISVLEVLVNPQPGSTLVGALPGLLFTGTLFVVPAALFAAATLWLIRSGRVAVTPLTAAFGIIIAALLALLFGAGLGILSGAAVALALERPERRTTIGIALFALLLVIGIAPFVPAMFAERPTRSVA
jgi:hypothetical protein